MILAAHTGLLYGFLIWAAEKVRAFTVRAFLFVRKILLCRIPFLCFISVFHFCVSFLPSVLEGV